VALFPAGPGRFTPRVSAPVLTHDLALGHNVHPAFAAEDVLVADRGVWASAPIARLVRLGMPAVCRVGARQLVDCTPPRPCVMAATRRSASLNGRPRSRWIRACGTDDPRVDWFTPRTCPPWLRPDTLEALPPSVVGRARRDLVTQRGLRSRQLTRVPPWIEAERYPGAD